MPIQSQDRILNNARVHLPGVLDDAMKIELFNVFDEFLNETSIWQEDVLFGVNIVDLTYSIAPSQGNIIRLIGVKNSDLGDVYATMEVPGEIVFRNLASKVDTYTAKVVLNVVDPIKSDGYPEIPEWIMQKYQMTLTDGLIGHMMAQPAKPYQNEKYAIYRLRRFRNGIAIARSETTRTNIQGAARWRFPRFA